MMKFTWIGLLGVVTCLLTEARAETFQLAPAASPADNPLKGLVPYADANVDRFPHSLEFNYLKLSDLMVGRDTFDWKPLESKLDLIASRGCQAVFRIWIEYPNQPSGVPQFLIEDGLKVTSWTNTEEKPASKNITPDYEDERLVSALERFVQEFGQRYDGDQRLGFLTAGLLGSWGEWHSWPRDELFASKATQRRVLKAYAQAFTKTPVLLRYPAGKSNPNYVANDDLPFGYHDDSFAWGTLDTGNPDDSWFYMNLLTKAGDNALNKWKKHPIGGEIRPEVWGQIFDAKPTHKQAQDFAKCVQQTHASWLMDSGMFNKKPSADRVHRATEAVRQMGYDFYVQSARIDRTEAQQIEVELQVRNNGVAPFYYDWSMELAVLSSTGDLLKTYPVDWKLTTIAPSATPTIMKTMLLMQDLPDSAAKLALRVVNPLPKGKPLRFANADQDADAAGWLTLGPIPK
jgi:hypothetical protein